MKILSDLTIFLIKHFKITHIEFSYRHLMLIVSLLISTLGFLGFAIKAFSTHSLDLAYVLAGSTLLNIINLVFLKLRSTFKLSSLLFIISFLLTMAFLVFDSGRSGYGYIWFYAIPVVNISILGVKRGTIYSLAFLLFLLIMFVIPGYYISIEYNTELKPRLIISLFALILLILFREWTVDFFKNQRRDEESIAETKLEYNRTAIVKLSNQIRHVTNEILNSIKKIKIENPKAQLLKPVDSIHDSSLNLINIVNSIGEFSELNLKEDETGEDYNLHVEIENTTNLFSSYKVDVRINIDKSIPVIIHGNSLLIKQIVYNIIENFINNYSGKTNKIDIDIYKGSESWEYLEIKYQVVNLLVDRESYNEYQQNCKLVELYSVNDDVDEIKRMGLKSIFALVEKLNGVVNFKKSKYFSSICFNHKVMKDDNFKKATISESFRTSSTITPDTSADLSKRKLNKMRVLLMEDNPITQKSILFTLDKAVKKLDIASNGKEGLDMFNINHYDLVLLDMNMPIIDGYEVARKIRNIEQGTRLHIPIIAIISDFLYRNVENIKAAGVDDYLHKPLKTNDLVNKIDLFLDRQKNKVH